MDFKFHEIAMDRLILVASEDELFKTAARKSRKQLQKDLNDAKNHFTNARMDLAQKKKVFRELGESIRSQEEAMGNAKKNVLKTYDILKNMDLMDLNEVRMVGDDVGYVKNQRIYRLEDRDGDFELVPWKKKIEDSEKEEEFNPDDLFDALEARQ